MSDAPAAPVTEQGVPPATQTEEAPSFKVFVGNLAYSTTDEGLKAFFEPVQSDIVSTQIIMRGNRPAGYGFVALSTAEAAQTAVEVLHKTQLDDRQIIVEIAKQPDQKERDRRDRKPRRRIGRRGSKAVPGEVTEAEANGEAKTEDATVAEGEAPKPKKKKKKTVVSLMCSFIRRKPRASSAAADGGAEPVATTSEGEAIPVRRRRNFPPRRVAGEEPTGEPSKSVLFVANLGFNIDDDALTSLFTEAGINVISARIVRRQYGRPRKSKGYGFVDVGDEAEQKKAIEALEGKDVGGRPIAVKVAVNAQAEEAREEAVAEEEGTPENERNRTKSRRQLELESREEGLSKSLFERAEDDKAIGHGAENKALSMMMKMGFKPGQALGVPADVDQDEDEFPSPQPPPSPAPTPTTPRRDVDPSQETSILQPAEKQERHLVNPLPLNEWSGKKGIGLGKRAPSPAELERLAKVARASEEADKESFRDRTRREFEQRRAEARLEPAQRTCATLDERAGKEFNVLWLDPTNPDSFPLGLEDVLAETTAWDGGDITTERKLRAQMRADALRPLDDGEDLPRNTDSGIGSWPPEMIDEAAQFLRLNPTERLSRVLHYLRAEYYYCFWCGTQYKSSDEMREECPGPDEDMHD
ncbi:hypothetical protein BJV78DRAFT_1274148 [Lactifluus subvellereus]|nr:hypothetical protein BJV78DRAFT_1274148 [Lactifluus subvellereus]